MPERRMYVKRLVAYHKHAEEWFAELQKKRRQFFQKDMVTA